MLEVASELVGVESWEAKQARIDLRAQGASDWEVSLFASDGNDGLSEVLAGRSTFAILNPATALRSGVRRLTQTDDLPVRAIATIPSFDQFGIAVPRDLGVATLADLIAARPTLTVSLRGARPNHSVHMVLDDVLTVHKATIGDFESWGGTVRYDEGLPHGKIRAAAIKAGEADAIIDEGIYNWVELAYENGLGFLSVDNGALGELEKLGYRRGLIDRDRFPMLPNDVVTLDFSGFLVYARSDVGDEVVTEFCRALLARAGRIPWQGGDALPLRSMVSDALDAPIPIPLHPAAQAFWQSHGLVADVH